MSGTSTQGRPLVITDCDEVLLRMVAHFRDWLGEAHDIDFAFQSDFGEALTRREDGAVVEQREIWRLLNAFFDTQMDRQDPVAGAVEAYGQLAEKADVVVLTNLLDHRQDDRARQLARGADSRLPWGNHKSTVLSLREIAEGLTDRGVLEEAELPAVQQPKMELEALDPSFDA